LLEIIFIIRFLLAPYLFDSIFDNETSTCYKSGFNKLVFLRILRFGSLIGIDEYEETVLLAHEMIVGESSHRIKQILADHEIESELDLFVLEKWLVIVKEIIGINALTIVDFNVINIYRMGRISVFF